MPHARRCQSVNRLSVGGMTFRRQQSGMPFTPFHMGAGLTAKAVLDGRISVISFGIAQVLMDIEPGVRMLTGKGDLHGWTHTLAGALAIGAIATLVTPLLIRPIVKRWNSELAHYRVHWLMVPAAPRKWAVAAGAFFGTLSHIVLDGIIHRDMLPIAPVSDLNPLMSLLGHDTVYLLCAAAAVAGTGAWLLRKWTTSRATTQEVNRPDFPRDGLHNSLRSVIARPRAVYCVAFFANSWAIGCKKTPCSPSRSALSPPREGYAGHPWTSFVGDGKRREKCSKG